ncbi:MAG TPA: hypothetical protein VFX44_10605 [Solirubrobacterales bacterium]|nr:hypothetical protein [Solirubrobacterales bacterium]
MSNTLKTATAVVGLLAGVVAGIYVMGGLVIALRLLFDHFSLQGAVTAVGQLPRESVVAMAMLNVIGPAVAFGLLAACAYGLFGRPQPRGGRGLDDGKGLERDQLTNGPLWRVALLFAGFLAIAVLGTLPALVEAIQTEHVSLLLVPCIYAAVVSYGIVAVGWYRIRRVAREDRSRLDRALVAGLIWAVVALLPALMLASAKPFETAQCARRLTRWPRRGG